MKQRITHISVHRTALVLAAVYVVIGLLFLPVIWLGSISDPQSSLPFWFPVLVPLLYGVFGYVFTAIAAAIYNVVAARIGGVEITLADTDAPPA